MNILVSGGCGYKGSVLVPKLLHAGHSVEVVDPQWFGNFLPSHANLTIVKKNIMEKTVDELQNFSAIIHLASVANDPCSDLDPKLTWETSCLATMKLADNAARAGIKRFIYASSGSVYGVSKAPQVTEDVELNPISEYNKTKMCAERILLSYSSDMIIQIVRPATVCGLSPRMRLDVAVNLLAMQALEKNRITVFGGKQVRPNIHIDDITDLYLFLLDKPDVTGIFNAGFENISIKKIADMVTNEIGGDIEIQESNDPRSYRVNSDKLLRAGFKPKKNVLCAIREIKAAYRQGSLKNQGHFHNLNWMKKTMYVQKSG